MIRKDYAQPINSNGLTAVGFIIRKYAYMIAAVLIMYIGGGLEFWL